MGVSTDGQICYGIVFPEGFSFPWDDDGDETSWWREATGFEPSKELFTDDGSYIGKPTDQELDNYFAEQNNWDETHPLPFAFVNYCSGDSPMYIIAIPETFQSNSRGFPEEFDPAQLLFTLEQKQNLIDFCEKYLGEAISEYNDEEYNDEKIVLEPKWYLTSYWG